MKPPYEEPAHPRRFPFWLIPVATIVFLFLGFWALRAARAQFVVAPVPAMAAPIAVTRMAEEVPAQWEYKIVKGSDQEDFTKAGNQGYEWLTTVTQPSTNPGTKAELVTIFRRAKR